MGHRLSKCVRKSYFVSCILLVLIVALSAIVAQTRPVEAADTPVGTNVSVTPFSQGVTITFSEVTVEGNSDVHGVQCGSPMGPGTGVRLSVPGLGQLYANAWFGKNAQGIGYQTGSSTCSTNMGYIFHHGDLLQYPVTVGRSWDLGRMTLNEGYVEGAAVIESVTESVSVPAGTFDCVRISKSFSYSRTPHLEEITSQQLWLAPGVGPVKSRNMLYGGTVVTGELSTYSLSAPSPDDYFPATVGDRWQFHWDYQLTDETYEVTETWNYPDLGYWYVYGPVDIFTTAAYEGPVTLAVHYTIPWWANMPEESLRLFQWDGDGWTDVTTSVDVDADTIHAETDLPLSVFFVRLADNTPAGSNVTVDPLAYTQPGVASLTYTYVSESGFTYANGYSEPQPSWGPLPEGFRVVESGFFDVKTTATYIGPIIGELSYAQLASLITSESGLKVFHWNGTEWEDVTTGVDTVNDIVYCRVSSLSPFFMGEPYASVATATGTGTAALVPDSGSMQNLTAISATSPSASLPQEAIATKPADVQFPHGLFEFEITGLTPSVGESVTLTITFPSAIPDNAEYWKYGPTPSNGNPHWYTIDWTRVSSNVITITLTDGSWGDDDLDANGTIIDQGGPGWPWPSGGSGGHSAPVFPSVYIGIGAALGAGILAYAVRRRLAAR